MQNVSVKVRQSMPRACSRSPRGSRWPKRARKGSSAKVRRVGCVAKSVPWLSVVKARVVSRVKEVVWRRLGV